MSHSNDESSPSAEVIPPGKRGSKRLKIGRACHTCRAKKIKCDGLRPCMQCKARQRPCSFYKDGLNEVDQDELPSEEHINDSNRDSNIDDLISPVRPTQESAPDIPTTSSSIESTILFSETTATEHHRLKRRGPLMESRISNVLNSLCEKIKKMSVIDSAQLAKNLLRTNETFGNFIMWMPEPSLPSRYSGSIEMPSREIQMALIDHFFNNRYENITFVPRYYFYEQLENKGMLITPLLLNVIYAHASRFVTFPHCPKTEVFYHRAKRLIDDFLDVPRVSTVVALCLLSLYESSPTLYRPGSQHCRSWQYSGMAFRMAIELGLYDDNNIHCSLLHAEIEARRRVFWFCYDLDKFQSGGWERPWMISKSFVQTLLPSPLPQETDDDKKIVQLYSIKIRLNFIVENGLNALSTARSFQLNQPEQAYDDIRKKGLLNMTTEYHAQLREWLSLLPLYARWTPTTPVSIEEILDLPAPRPMVAHLHLYYSTLMLDIHSRKPAAPTDRTNGFHARFQAACVTQLTYHLCKRPSTVIKFDFLAHVLASAIRIHMQYLGNEDAILSQQAWLLFNRCVWCIELINSYAVIPNCLRFLQQIQTICNLQSNRDSEPSKVDTMPLSDPNISNQDESSSVLQPIIVASQYDQTTFSDNNNMGFSTHQHENFELPTYLTGWSGVLPQEPQQAQGPSTQSSLHSTDTNSNSLNVFQTFNHDNDTNSNQSDRDNSMVYWSSYNASIHPQTLQLESQQYQYSPTQHSSHNNNNHLPMRTTDEIYSTVNDINITGQQMLVNDQIPPNPPAGLINGDNTHSQSSSFMPQESQNQHSQHPEGRSPW